MAQDDTYKALKCGGFTAPENVGTLVAHMEQIIRVRIVVCVLTLIGICQSFPFFLHKSFFYKTENCAHVISTVLLVSQHEKSQGFVVSTVSGVRLKLT